MVEKGEESILKLCIKSMGFLWAAVFSKRVLKCDLQH